MTLLEQLKSLVEKTTPGPWRADGPPHNRIVWREGTDNRVCFMAHSDGADTTRDIATSNLVAAAPEMFNLLVELIDIEGPQPGTGEWARKVHAVLAALEPVENTPETNDAL